MFECDMQIKFNLNSQQGLQDLIDSFAVVALGKSDITADMVAAGQISSMDTFKCPTLVRLKRFLTSQSCHAAPS